MPTSETAAVSGEQSLRYCPDCITDLPLDQFGVNNARRDGINLYCKPCTRKRIYKNREGARNYKREHELAIERQRRREPPPPAPRPLTFKEKVLKAIVSGARTQTEIALRVLALDGAQPMVLDSAERVFRLLTNEDGVSLTAEESYWQAKLLTDELGDALADLLSANEIRVGNVNGSRAWLPALKTAPVSREPQLSLFQFIHQLGPKSTGLSAQRGRVEKRVATEGLELPSHSRVA